MGLFDDVVDKAQDVADDVGDAVDEAADTVTGGDNQNGGNEGGVSDSESFNDSIDNNFGGGDSGSSGGTDSGSSSPRGSSSSSSGSSSSSSSSSSGSSSSGGYSSSGSSSSSSSSTGGSTGGIGGTADYDSGNDDSGAVVVTGDPSEGEEVEAVGSGDTLTEARTDAALNQGFDADPSTPTGRIEDRLQSNPGNNDTGAVVVTGGPGTGKEQKTVGRGNNILQARAAAAQNRGFDADPGTPTDALETGKQSQGTNPRKLVREINTQTRNRTTNNNTPQKGILQNATEQNIYSQTNAADPNSSVEEDRPLLSVDRGVRNVEGVIENLQESKAAELVDPTQSVDGQRDFGNEVADVGSEIIRGSERGAEKATKRLPIDFIGNPVGQTVASAELAGRGNFDKAAEEFFIPGTQTELAEKRVDQSAEGIIQGPGTLAGFTAGATGGTIETLSNDIEKQVLNEDPEGETTGEAILTGLGLQGEAISKNPGRFATQEISEEIGEGISTAGVGLLAPTVTIEPTISGDTRTGQAIEKAKTARDTGSGLITGDLGTRVRQDQLISRDIDSLEQQALEQRLRNLEATGSQKSSAQIAQEIDSKTPTDLEGTTLLEETVNTGEDGAIIREVQGVKQGQAVQGTRIETPVSRREFLNERLNTKDLARAGILGLQGAAAAAGAPTTTATTGISLNTKNTVKGRPESSPDTIDPDEVFSDTRSAGAETSLTNTRRQTPAIDSLEEEISELSQENKPQQDSPVLDETLIDSQILDQTPQQETTPQQEQTPEQEFTLEQTLIPEQELRPEPDPTLTSSQTTTNTPSVDGSSNDNQDNLLADLVGDEQDFQFTESVASELLNLEGDGKTSELSAGNPFNLRSR